jgi:hypothetical protein
MADDSTLVALIKESMEAPEPARRAAAALLLAALRNREGLDQAKLDIMEADSTAPVREEIRALAEQFGLMT